MGKHVKPASAQVKAANQPADLVRRSRLRRSQRGLKPDPYAKPGKAFAALAGLALVLSGLIAVLPFAEKAQAQDWPNAGKPGSIQGYVYDDAGGHVEDFNPSLGDKAIPNVKMNAFIVKSDGTVITDHEPDGRPKPYQVTTDDKGYYSFYFTPQMAAAYRGKGTGDQIKLAAKDRVRVWPDQSNYEPGGALAGHTAKRLNGGTRLTEIDTLTLSWLGTTNYLHGSISNMNMAYRPKTQFTADPKDWGTKEQAKHFDNASWKPTELHDIPLGIGHAPNPYLCGAVYSDVTFRYDRWDGRGDRDTNSEPDRVVPGVRVAVTTYKTNFVGTPEEKIETRYDYTDKNGRWCIKWDSVEKMKNWANNPARMMVSIEPPKTKEQGQAEIEKLKPKSASNAYQGVEPLIESQASGLPLGFSSTGSNGWHGTIRPVDAGASLAGVGYSNLDVACATRGAYCLPDLLWGAIGKSLFRADGADLGLIPGEIEANFFRHADGDQKFKIPRYNAEAGKETVIDVKLDHVSATIDPHHIVVMVPKGADPKNPDNWAAASDGMVNGQNTSSLTLSSSLPVGDYSFYTYSLNKKTGQPEFAALHDIDGFRITDTKGYYYTDSGQRDQAISKLENGENPDKDVSAVPPGTQLFNAYQDLGLVSSKVYLVPAGKPVTDPAAKLMDGNLQGYLNPDKVWMPYIGKDKFTIAQNTEPGNYDLVIISQHDNEVDRHPLTVTGPKLTVEPGIVKTGGKATAKIKDLNPDTEYQVIFTPAGGGAPITVDVPSHNEGTAQVDLVIPNDENKAKYLGLGTVKLVKKGKDQSLSEAPLMVSNARVYGPQIILPGKQDPNPANDDYLAAPSANSFFCGGRKGKDLEDCIKDTHAAPGSRFYKIAVNGRSRLDVHAINLIPDPDHLGNYLPEYAPGRNDKHWDVKAVAFGVAGAVQNTDWPLSFNDREENRLDPPFAGGVSEENRFFVATILYTNDKGESDVKQIILHRASGGQHNYGEDFKSTAGVLTVGVPIPEGKYCMSGPADKHINQWRWAVGANNDDPSRGKPYYKNYHLPPKGISIDQNGCLTGTPEEATEGEDFQDFFAEGKGNTGWWAQSIGDRAPLTVRLAIRNAQDQEAPTITGTTTKNATVANNGTITVQQGDKLPLVITGSDNKKLQIFKISTPDDKLPAGITAPSADPEVGGDTAQQKSTIDFTGQTVASNAAVGVYPVKVVAMDGSENLTEYTVNIEVTKKLTPPVFTDETAPAGEVGLVYQSDNAGWTVPVSDDQGIKNLQVTSGSLPEGLQLTPQKDGSYKITGTPAKAGDYSFELTATDKDGATSKKSYTIKVNPTTTPEWDDATNGLSDELTIEIGKQQDQPWMSVAVKPVAGRTPVYHVQPKENADDPDTPSIPAGLTFKDGKLEGVAKKLDPSGTRYLFTADFGGDKVTKEVLIKVVDTTGPKVNPIKDQTVKVGETVAVPLSAVDNSGDPVTFQNAICKTDAEKALAVRIENGQIVSSPLAQGDLGTYQCSVEAKDSSNNLTKVPFELVVRPEGPILSVTPKTQTVQTNGQVTPIKEVIVEHEDGSELDVSDCTKKLPASIKWDAEGQIFKGTVNDRADKTYSCTITATKDGKQTTSTLEINVDGPVSGPTQDNDGNFLVEGRVGKPIDQTTPFAVDGGGTVTIEPADQQTLKEYGLEFKDGKITGTPTKPTYTGETPAAIDLQLTATIPESDGNPAKTVNVPVKLTIHPATKITGIPENGTPGDSFTPTVHNPESKQSYTVKLCAADDTNCDQPIAQGPAGSALQIPADATGTLKVVAQDSNGNSIPLDHDTITLAQIGITSPDGSALPATVQGGASLPAKVKNPATGVTYTAKLCKQSDTDCANPVASKTGITAQAPGIEGITLPVNGSENADPNGVYQLKLFPDQETEPVVTKTITATTGNADLSDPAKSNYQVEIAQAGKNLANGSDAYLVKVTLKDDKGNPVADKANNLKATQQGIAEGVSIGNFQAVSNQPGVYQAMITSTTAGEATVAVKLDGKPVPLAADKSKAALFVAGDADLSDPNHSNFTVSTGNKAADGGVHTVTVKLADANGNPVAGKAAQLSGSTTGLDGATVGQFSEVSGQPGVYSANLTSQSKKAGKATVSVTLSGQAVSLKSGGNNQGTFVAGALDPAQTTVKVTTADGTDQISTVTAGTAVKVTVTPKDANGNPVDLPAGTTVRIPGVANPVTLSKNEDGTYSAEATPVKATKTDDAKKVTFPDLPSLDNKATLEVTAGTPTQVEFKDVPTSATAGEQVAEKNAGTATVKDKHGNPVPNQDVWVKVPGAQDPVKVTTDQDGKIKVPAFTPAAPTDDKIKIYRPNDDNSGADTSEFGKLGEKSVTINVGDADGTKSEFTASPTNPITGTDVTISGTMKDKAGNPISGGQFTVKLPDGTTIPATTNDQGQLVAKDPKKPLKFVAGTPGAAQQVALFKGKTASGEPFKTATVTPRQDPAKIGVPVVDPQNPKSKSYATIDQGPKLADNSQNYTVTVKLVNSYGDPIPNAQDKLQISTSTEGYKSNEPDKNISFYNDGQNEGVFVPGAVEAGSVNGTYVIHVKSSKVGTADLQVVFKDGAEATEIAIPNGDNGKATLPAQFKAGSVDSSHSTIVVKKGEQVLTDGSNPADKQQATAGDQLTIVYTPKDANGHLVTDLAGPVTVTVPGAGDTSQTVTLKKQSDGTWTGTVNAQKAGDNPVTSTIGPKDSPQTGPHTKLKVVAGAPATEAASDAPKGTLVTEFESPSGAVKKDDTNKKIVIKRLTDAYGNPVTPGNKLSVDLTKDDQPPVTHPTITPGKQGTYTVDVPTDTEGSKKFQFKWQNDNLGNPVTVVVTEKTAGVLDTGKSNFEVTPSVAGKTEANGSDSYTVTITLKDRDGQPLTGKAPAITVTGLPAQSEKNAGYQLTSVTEGANGVYTATLTSTKAGTGTVAVTVDSQNLTVKDSHNTAVFTVGAPASATITVPKAKESPSSGTEVTDPGTITVKDGSGNPIPNQDVWVKVPGAKDPVKVTTDQNGEVKIPNYTPGTTTDNKIVVYKPNKANDGADTSENGKLGEKQITVVPGTPAAANTSLVLTPNNPTEDGGTVPTEGTPVTVGGVVKDSAGNPIPGRNLTVVVQTGNGDPVTIPAKTDASGNLVNRNTGQPITFNAGSNGQTSTVKLFDQDETSGTPLNSKQITAGKDASKTGVPVFNQDKTRSKAEITAGSKKADGTAAHTITVTLLDAYGEPVTGKANQIVVRAKEGSIVPSFGSVTEGKNGTYTIAVTSTAKGTAQIDVNYREGQQSTAIPGSPLAATFIAGGAGAATVDMPDQLVAGQKACANDSCSVTVTDAHGNPVAPGTKVWVKLPGQKTPVEVTIGADGKGVIPAFTPTTAGTDTVVVYGDKNGAADPNNPLGTKEITIKPGAPTTVDWPKDDQNKDKPIEGVAGETQPSPGKVTVKDNQGNPVPNTPVKVKVPGGETVQVTTDQNGQIDIPGFTPTDTDKKIKISDDKGKVIGEKEVTVSKRTDQPSDVTANNQGVKGKAPAGSKVVVTVPKGSTTCSLETTADQDGNFKVKWTKDCPKPTGTDAEVSVTAEKEGELPSNPTKAKVKTGLPEDPQVTVKTDKDGNVTVTITPGKDNVGKPDLCINKTQDGKTTCVPVDPDQVKEDNGKYIVVIPADQADDADSVTVTAKNEDGNTTDVTKPIPPLPGYPSKPTIILDKAHPDQVTGKADPGNTVVVCVTAAKQVKNQAETRSAVERAMHGKDRSAQPEAGKNCVETVAGPDGTYRVKVPTLQDGDLVEVTATDPDSGNSSTNKKVVDFTPPAAATDIQVTDDGKTVKGKGEPGTTATVTLPDGTKVNGKVDQDGNFSIPLPDGKQLKPGDKIVVTLTDQAGNSSEPTEFTYQPAVAGPVNPGKVLATTGALGGNIGLLAGLMLVLGAAVISLRRRETK